MIRERSPSANGRVGADNRSASALPGYIGDAVERADIEWRLHDAAHRHAAPPGQRRIRASLDVWYMSHAAGKTVTNEIARELGFGYEHDFGDAANGPWSEPTRRRHLHGFDPVVLDDDEWTRHEHALTALAEAEGRLPDPFPHGLDAEHGRRRRQARRFRPT